MTDTKLRAYRFHESNPSGKIFNNTESEFEELAKDGWVESPAKLKNQPKKEQAVTAEQAKSMDPQSLVAMVKSMGYEVFTPDMLQAEINKALSVPIDVNTVPDHLIESEYKLRFNTVAPMSAEPSENVEASIDELQDQFNEEPESLIVDELVALGNIKYKLGLRSNMKEATLIVKIKEAQKASNV